jgi:hypothetical protein
MGTIFVLEFIYLIYFWQVAPMPKPVERHCLQWVTYRADCSPP